MPEFLPSRDTPIFCVARIPNFVWEPQDILGCVVYKILGFKADLTHLNLYSSAVILWSNNIFPSCPGIKTGLKLLFLKKYD